MVPLYWSPSRLSRRLGPDRGVGLNTANSPEIIRTMEASSVFLSMLGVKATLGRLFNEREDNVPTDSIIVSDAMWRNRLGARADVIGERVSLRESPQKTIIGVLEPGFQFEGEPPEVLMPVGISAEVSRQYLTAGMLALVTLLVTLLPARRASQANPILALPAIELVAELRQFSYELNCGQPGDRTVLDCRHGRGAHPGP